MKRKAIPDTIGVSLDTRENLRKASQSMTALEIPGYDLNREIGRGNFGTVWQAKRHKTGQMVAIKIVDLENDLDWAYFRRELDFLRELEDHPNTLTILDAQLDAEPPYIVMPLADGGSLEEKAREEKPSMELLERWLTQMAEALVFIHRKGVIHCDFKPSNVLLTSDLHVRVGDLGQARRTGHGVALGTIGFMAPEQCDEKTKATPSVSWDVYAFGATAYWLLTGKVPRTDKSQPTTLGEYIECFETTELDPIRQLNPAVDSELASIVEACLRLDPAKRTPSIDAILIDFKRRQENQPLYCRKPWPLPYVLRMALRRRPVQVFVAALIVGMIASIFAWQERQQNLYFTHLTAGIHAHESGRIEEAYLQWLEALGYDSGNQALVSRLDFMPLAQIYPHRAKVTDLILADDGKMLVSSSVNGEVLTWNRQSGELSSSLSHGDYVADLAVSEEQGLLATASWDGQAHLYELGSSEPKNILKHPGDDNSINWLVFCGDGSYLATSDSQGRVLIWESKTGNQVLLKDPPLAPFVQHLAGHPESPLLAALTDFNQAGVWDLAADQKFPIVISHEGEINDLTFTPDGQHLLSASDDGTAKLWELSTGRWVRDFDHDSRVNKILALPNGRLVTGCEDGSANYWDFEQEGPVHQFFHRRPVRSLAHSEDLTLVAVGTGEAEHLWSDIEANGTVKVWDLVHGYEVSGPWPHDGPIQNLVFVESEQMVLSASGSARQNTAAHPGAVRAWHYILPESIETDSVALAPQSPVSTLTLEGVTITHGSNVLINQHAVSPVGDLVATASDDRTVRLWSAIDGTPQSSPLLLDGYAQAVTFNQDGTLLAASSKLAEGHSITQVWEVASGYPISPPMPTPGFIRNLEFSGGGSTLLARSEDAAYRWDLGGTEEGREWAEHIPSRLRVRLDDRGSVVPAE